MLCFAEPCIMASPDQILLCNQMQYLTYSHGTFSLQKMLTLALPNAAHVGEEIAGSEPV